LTSLNTATYFAYLLYPKHVAVFKPKRKYVMFGRADVGFIPA